MSNSKYAGEFEIVLEKKNDKTVKRKKRFAKKHETNNDMRKLICLEL